MRTGSVKQTETIETESGTVLSVSSMRTGSVKPEQRRWRAKRKSTFSVLDADRFGETSCAGGVRRAVRTFSVLDADRFGETCGRYRVGQPRLAFSVLDADRFGETAQRGIDTERWRRFQCPRCGPVR